MWGQLKVETIKNEDKKKKKGRLRKERMFLPRYIEQEEV